MGTSPGDQYPVYVGLWTNWSRGQIMGATLTLKRQDADLLIAFTALFITYVATRTWRILWFVFHRYYSTTKAQDALYHQCQAILRNSSSPEGGLRQLMQVAKVNWGSRSIIRPLAIATAAMVCTATFTVAGGFSSRVSTSVGSEVLIRSANCGVLNQPGYEDTDQWADPLPYEAERLNNAANYAQQCYSDSSSGLLDCRRFITQQISVDINSKAACPFNNHSCRDNSNNIILDSGFIDSHRHLGQNAPSNERIRWRTVLICAPLDSARFTSQGSAPKNYTLYHFGTRKTPLGDRDYVYKAVPVEAQYSDVLAYDSVVTISNYQINVLTAELKNGTYLPNASFVPVDSISRQDADLILIFLSGNGVLFVKPTEDAWYRTASTPTDITFVYSDGTRADPRYYLPREPASPLGCINQHQFCNTGIQESGQCGPLASLRDAIAGVAPLFNSSYSYFVGNFAETESQARFLYFMNTFFSYDTSIYGILSQLGPAALHSQRKLIQGQQAAIEPNQWQLDIARFWNISMAATQEAFIDAAYGPTDPKVLAFHYNYTAPELVKICNNQKIRSTAHASFSVFWLVFILVAGLLLISTSYLLEVVSEFLAKRKGYRQHAHLEWNTNTTLQLQRLAHEELGLGTWSRCADDVPATMPGELLGLLDISDLKHPVLHTPEEVDESPQSDDQNAEESPDTTVEEC
ncbi:hypothetical protein ANO14919_141110 [Xylariales sp. No.14919]|nr:hypothetical protein ANO14919_141110 [Xylariales sp. No.14919]